MLAMRRGYCEWRRRETGTTSTYGKLAKFLAPDGNKVGPPFKKVDAAVHNVVTNRREL